MDKKEKFTYPEIEIIELNENDFIVTTSGEDYTPVIPIPGGDD